MSCCRRGLDGGDPYGIEVTVPSEDGEDGSEVGARLSSALTSIERRVGERVASAMTGDGDGEGGGGDGCKGFAVEPGRGGSCGGRGASGRRRPSRGHMHSRPCRAPCRRSWKIGERLREQRRPGPRRRRAS
mmetsp:Transcript_19099/g.44713  ORF Transcript_19099/g.44713 Transcript_19099/m.44713 type:complete len:131 (-) Transcript_19099:306-698(-)